MVRQCCKSLVNNFVWIEETCQFNEDLIKTITKKMIEDNFFEVNVEYCEKILELQNDLPFLHERMKIEKVKKLVASLHDKT